MKRINIFVKGNVDVYDSLVYSRINGRILWNGLNALLAERGADVVVRTRHEPCARWDLTGTEGRGVPSELAARNLDLGSFTLDVQFRSKLLDSPADVLVLSIQADVMNPLCRHRRDGYAFFAVNGKWLTEDRRWLDDAFT